MTEDRPGGSPGLPGSASRPCHLSASVIPGGSRGHATSCESVSSAHLGDPSDPLSSKATLGPIPCPRFSTKLEGSVFNGTSELLLETPWGMWRAHDADSTNCHNPNLDDVLMKETETPRGNVCDSWPAIKGHLGDARTRPVGDLSWGAWTSLSLAQVEMQTALSAPPPPPEDSHAVRTPSAGPTPASLWAPDPRPEPPRPAGRPPGDVHRLRQEQQHGLDPDPGSGFPHQLQGHLGTCSCRRGEGKTNRKLTAPRVKSAQPRGKWRG